METETSLESTSTIFQGVLTADAIFCVKNVESVHIAHYNVSNVFLYG